MAATPVPPSGTGTQFLDLPDEIQNDIFTLCPQQDLISLALACKRFRELAASQLYRHFNIVFPDEDDPSFDSPIDGLAAGLDTFVTSDYNYAQHLRGLSLDTLSAGSKAEVAYKPYLYSLSCGKFMNTLLLLTLKKAKHLDAFRWNIRVELSRGVYKALHDIPTLKHVHLRMQQGPSLYEPPPPLPHALPHAPANQSTSSSQISSHLSNNTAPLVGNSSTNLLAQPPVQTPFSAHSPSLVVTLPFSGPPPAAKSASKGKASKKSTAATNPPTISGFQKLSSLAVLDMDNLDTISEIKTCIRNSASTLRSLKLSFSDSLAQQARKPCVDSDPDDSDVDDEFQIGPIQPLQNTYDAANAPIKAYRAQEEKKRQEAVLGRIFEIEPDTTKGSDDTREEKPLGGNSGVEVSTDGAPMTDPAKCYIDSMRQISERLLASTQGSSDMALPEQQDILDMIVKAAKQYVDSNVAEPQRDAATNEGSKSEETGTASQSNEPSQTDANVKKTDSEKSPEQAEGSSAGAIFNKIPKLTSDNDMIKPEDIDVTAPEEQIATEPADELSASVSRPDSPHLKPSSQSQSDKQAGSLEDLGGEPFIKEIPREDSNNVVDKEDSLVKTAKDTGSEDLRRRATDYTRRTRGVALESLAIHLIPIKATVLHKAIDIHTLQKITLLNVGPQAPFWGMLFKENKQKPLQLRKIFTDNVSVNFFHLVHELERVDDLFIIERSNKYNPESFAPKTKTTIQQIRHFILKKHMRTLQRLMIKNESDSSWDLDGKTCQLICRSGRNLEELAGIMGVGAMHVFLQYMSGLEKLVALHLIALRSDDTCLSVMRETRRFIVDTVSYHPNMRLEWLSMGWDDRVQRIIRNQETEVNSPTRSKSFKGKGVATSGISGGSASGQLPVLPALELEDSDSEEDDDSSSSKRLKLLLVHGIAFYDVWGVRIYEKEIMTGRL